MIRNDFQEQAVLNAYINDGSHCNIDDVLDSSCKAWTEIHKNDNGSSSSVSISTSISNKKGGKSYSSSATYYDKSKQR